MRLVFAIVQPGARAERGKPDLSTHARGRRYSSQITALYEIVPSSVCLGLFSKQRLESVDVQDSHSM